MRNLGDLPYLLLTLAFLLALSWGYLFGRWLAIPDDPLTLLPDTRPLIPTVHFTGVRNGNLEGVIRGSGRLVIGDAVVIPESDGAFSVDGSAFLLNRVTVTVPDGMAFMASKKGKKYHPVFSAAGNKIVPGNRVYFHTAGEAEAAGYVR